MTDESFFTCVRFNVLFNEKILYKNKNYTSTDDAELKIISQLSNLESSSSDFFISTKTNKIMKSIISENNMQMKETTLMK